MLKDSTIFLTVHRFPFLSGVLYQSPKFVCMVGGGGGGNDGDGGLHSTKV